MTTADTYLAHLKEVANALKAQEAQQAANSVRLTGGCLLYRFPQPEKVRSQQ